MNTESQAAGNLQIAQQVERLQAVGDPATRAATTELVGSVLELHRSALERMLEILSKETPNASQVQSAFERDELVRSVLLLHDLHSQTIEERTKQTVEDLRPKLERYGATATIVEASERRVQIVIRGREGGCGSTTETVRWMVEASLAAIAPDAAEITVEWSGADKSFVPIESIQVTPVAAGNS